MNDQEILNKLIAHDEQATEYFFFKRCRPLFMSVIKNVFSYEVDYDEFVNEYYIHLMENDAYRLRQFEGRSSIYQWMKVIAIRFFMAKRDNMIDMESKEYLLASVPHNEIMDTEKRITAKMQIEQLFNLMQNKRYVYVIKRLVLEGVEPEDVAFELETNVNNIYNIKKRALDALTKVALKEIEKYEKGICK